GLAVSRLVEETADGAGDLGPDAVDLVDLRLGGLLQIFHGAEAYGEELGRAFAHHADAQAVEEAREPAGLRRLDGAVKIGGGLLGQALELRELLHREVIEIREVVDDSLVHQLGDDALAQVLDVHGPAPAPVEEALLELGGAGAIGAAPDGLALWSLGRRAAGRAAVGHAEGHGAGGTLVLDDLDEIRDHVPRALDEHGVAHADVLPAHLVLVVEA